MEVVKFKHTVNSGDLIAALAGIRHVHRSTKKKAVIYQRLDVPGDYYPGAYHPLQDENGVQVTMTQGQWNMLAPLLLAQPYIHEVDIWEGQDFDVDLHKVREQSISTNPHGSINRWTWYADPALACSLAQQWLFVEKSDKFFTLSDRSETEIEDKILVNFTDRYRNPLITYYFLKKYEDRVIFLGTDREHYMFCNKNKLSIPRLVVEDFLELAQAINQCSFVLANQSMVWNIAEALKVPRVLEVCAPAANCVPVGENAYDFLHQGAAEFYVDRMVINPKMVYHL